MSLLASNMASHTHTHTESQKRSTIFLPPPPARLSFSTFNCPVKKLTAEGDKRNIRLRLFVILSVIIIRSSSHFLGFTAQRKRVGPHGAKTGSGITLPGHSSTVQKLPMKWTERVKLRDRKRVGM